MQVAAFLRSILYDPEMRVNGGCLVAYEPLATAAAEKQLLQHVQALYSDNTLPAALEGVSSDQGFGVHSEHMDLVLFSLLHHFKRHQRWRAALSVFSSLAEHHAAAAVYVAAAHRGLGDRDKCGEVLGQALERDPLSAPLMVAMAAECLSSNQVRCVSANAFGELAASVYDMHALQ